MSLPSFVAVGATFKNRSGAEYRVVELDNRGGFIASRANGKTFKVSGGMVRKALRMAADGPVPFRKVNYTVAIESGAVWAAGLTTDTTTKTYTL